MNPIQLTIDELAATIYLTNIGSTYDQLNKHFEFMFSHKQHLNYRLFSVSLKYAKKNKNN